MSGINYAVIQQQQAYLSGEFGLSYAMRIFKMTEEELAELCGRYVRGKRKGLIKGQIAWTKVVKGGWKKDGPGYGYGHVVRPGSSNHRLEMPVWGGEPVVIAEITGHGEVYIYEEENND